MNMPINTMESNITIIIEENNKGELTVNDKNFKGEKHKISENTKSYVEIIIGRNEYINELINSPIDEFRKSIKKLYMDNFDKIVDSSK